MPTTVYDQFTHRTADVTAQLTTLGIPLTAPVPPLADTGLTDPWASSHTAPVDRSTLAWCTAVTMLATHHDTGIDRQVDAADALLRELGVRGLAQLDSDLRGAPVDYRFTPCPYCSGIGEDPALPDCRDVGCPPEYEYAGHDHLCPVCPDSYEPQWFAEEQMTVVEGLLAGAIEEREEHAALRYRIRTRLRRWTVRTSSSTPLPGATSRPTST
ncbi:hypothetical protein JHN53_17180 [Streptomyces sp. MBT58]|uniref:hypothetical protein n=1 Tax=Streptomyces sp. MBT58 TaxID=1488389 RepID=UPI001913C021|nr:hypothetical protein [Streptomyces sp. MBT58]MBK5993344.1 hypothetical protein [Streptomyces sp. MBT58]